MLRFRDKLRQLRKLRGLTQKKLGLKIGFSESTADARIRKYEGCDMKPKKEIRNKLISALEVDPSALSDTKIESDEEVMQVFFWLEEEYGMTVKNSDKKISLVFYKSNKRSQQLINYLLAWSQERENLRDLEDPAYMETKSKYKDWKSKFPTLVKTNEQ